MGPLDWLLLAVIATGTFFALRAVRRGHTGSCCGDCARCRRTDCGKNSIPCCINEFNIKP